MKRLLCLAITLLSLLLLRPPLAGAQQNLSLEVQAGFDGFYKTDHWTPVRVTIANEGADLQAEVRLRDDYAGFGASNILYVYPLEIPGRSRKQLSFYLPLRGQSRLVVDLVDPGGNLLLSQQTRVVGLDEQALLIGVIGSDPSLLNELAAFATVDDQRIAVAHLKPIDLPATLQAWTGLDILICNDVDTSQLTAGQQDALSSWVRFGGRLVVGGGPNAAQTMAGLQALLPFSNIRLETLPHPVIALQNFTSTATEDRGPYVAAVPGDVTGRILAQEGDWPLIIAVRRGLGRVAYVAFDLSLAPLDVLAGQPQFLTQLAGPLRPRNGFLADSADLSQLRSSLSLIPDQTLPRPGTVVLYLVIYILAMGPANYFILRRLKRGEWAWFTIPAVILLFSGYGYFSGFRLRGGRSLIRQITIIQAEVGAPLADVTALIGVYSPYRADYTLEIDRPVLIESLPNSFGLSNELVVSGGDTTTLENLRGDIGGMPAIIAHHQAAPPHLTANLSYHRAGRRVQGSIRNETDQAITQALLLIENQVLDLGILAPGETQVDGVVVAHNAYDNFYQPIRFGDNSRELLAMASRDMTVRAMFSFNGDKPDIMSPNPVGSYLIGWQQTGPLTVTPANSRSDRMSETLLVVGLPVSVN